MDYLRIIGGLSEDYRRNTRGLSNDDRRIIGGISEDLGNVGRGLPAELSRTVAAGQGDPRNRARTRQCNLVEGVWLGSASCTLTGMLL